MAHRSGHVAGCLTLMDRRIIGYVQDAERQWIARLDCGHRQHVRHDPPWQVREWVTSPEGRARFLGTTLNCLSCDADIDASTGRHEA